MLICFFGKRGSGKTYTINKNLKNAQGPVMVLDFLGNFQDPKYIQTDDISDAITQMQYYLENHKFEKKLQKIIVLKSMDSDVAADFISKALWDAEGGTLVLDEIDMISEAQAPWFDYVIRYGRNKNIDVITGCRRPAEISRNITAGANRIFIFQTQEPRDIEFYEKTSLGERAYALSTMDEYHGLYIDYDEKSVGVFRVDNDGTIRRLTKESINKPTTTLITEE